MIERREVAFGSEWHARGLALRDEILRRPLGIAFSPEEVAAEPTGLHLVLTEGEAVLAVAVIVAGDPAKVRQVAVVPGRRGEGLGAEIMAFAEETARRGGSRAVYLHARADVVSFYTKLGYVVGGEPFEEVGIPHRRMIKAL